MNYELAALSEAHRAEVSALRHEIEAAVRDVVRRGVAAGVFSTPDPDLTAAALLSLGIDLAAGGAPAGAGAPTRWPPTTAASPWPCSARSPARPRRASARAR